MRTLGVMAAAIVIAPLLFNGCGQDSTGSPASSTSPTSAPGLVQLTVVPSSVTGGEAAQGEVTLSSPATDSGGHVVNISSSASAAAMPLRVTVPNGSTSASFSITTQPVAAETTVTINAAAGIETRTATLVVRPAAGPAIDQLMVDPSFEGGASTVGTVRLDKPALPSAPMAVRLTSDNGALLTVPETVTVSPGASTSTFTITTRPVSAETRVTVSASAGGQTRTAETLLRPRVVPPAGAGTFFSFVSASGDRVGQGKSASYRPGNATFTANTCSNRQVVNIAVRVSATESWTLQFLTPQAPLAPGTYASNGRHEPGDSYFHVEASGGRYCSPAIGRFIVTEAEYGSGVTIRRFRASFEQRCERQDNPLLTGEINLVDPPLAVGVVLC